MALILGPRTFGYRDVAFRTTRSWRPDTMVTAKAGSTVFERFKHTSSDLILSYVNCTAADRTRISAANKVSRWRMIGSMGLLLGVVSRSQSYGYIHAWSSIQHTAHESTSCRQHWPRGQVWDLQHAFSPMQGAYHQIVQDLWVSERPYALAISPNGCHNSWRATSTGKLSSLRHLRTLK